MNIVVLAGGLSTERDVSLITGTMVCNALKKNGHNAVLLDVFLGYETEEKDLEDIFEKGNEISSRVSEIQDMEPDIEQVKAMRTDQSTCFFGPNVLKMCQKADIVFMALHGENGENGKIQAAFDLLGIKYTGSGYLSSALAMDKGISKELFNSKGIPTPQGITIKKGQRSVSFKELNLNLPFVVKPCCGGSSIGVYIVKDEEEYKKALEAAFRYEDEVVIEEYIQGREFSVGVIERKALPVIEIAPIQGFYDYKNKYQAGSAIETCPAELSEEITGKMQRCAEMVCETLGLDTYSRMDFLLDANNNIYCLEANTLPGMTPTSLLPQEAAAVGISFEELCEKLIEVSLKKYS
ncbi:D-alanine--D-alanine ligase family protein [Anaerosacchariphilus polymeriproducens]|uniref:D-alanine--D-alanine ligase n=1 Tax=Anaerosacchariphilus polymeriproducens TaxID=1812858 RepID=A0A371AV64_9FIRM|nr:D-alanine--D-alanine ligase [Anaerosacchariphilus polymeriproducens]RDU23456.1 D-alanine--D-alanine ligase [Anaerosacchariphilus polymeriproducens]